MWFVLFQTTTYNILGSAGEHIVDWQDTDKKNSTF